MNSPPDPPRGRTSGAAPLDLRRVVQAVDRAWPGWEPALHRGAPAPWGFLVGVESVTGRLIHRPLDDHPVEVLTSWSAPDRWCAVGVAVRGIARRVADDYPPQSEARVVWVCHRDGRTASLLALPGEPAAVSMTHPDSPPPKEGRVPQLLRAALGGNPPLPPSP